MSTRSLGNLVVRLALELAEYKAGWKEAEDATRDGAARVDQANKGATQGADALKDALKRQVGAYGEAAGGAGEYGKAAVAATGISTGLALTLGAAAAAAVGLGVAAYKGAKEQQALNNSLLLTGNYAGLVTGQLDQMALSVASSIGGNVGHAREVLAGLVGTGRFTVESLGEVGQAVQLVAQYSGQTNAQVLKDFAGMADGVAKWAAKSNEAYHFLNIEQYRHIKTLEEQGRAQEAMAVTADALSDHLKGNLTQNLGVLERAWLGVSGAASKAWAAMKDLGKDQGIDAQINAVALRLENAKRGLGARSASGQDAIATQEAELRTLLRRKEILEGNALAQTANAQASERAIAADKRADQIAAQYATTSEKKAQALEEVRKVAESAGKSAEWLADQEEKINKRFAEKKRKGLSEAEKEAEKERRLLAELSGVTADYMEDLSRLNKMRAAGTLSEQQYVAAVTRLIEKQPMARALIKAQADETERLAKADIEAGKAREWHLAQLDKGLEKITAEIEKEQEHTRTLGLSKEAIAELVAAKLEDKAVSLELQAIREMDHNLDQAIYDATMRQAEAYRDLAQAKRTGAAKEAFHENLKQQEKDWDSFVGEIDKTFHDGYMQMLQNGEDGWDAWTKGLANTFKTTVADAIYKMFVKPLFLNLMGQVSGVGGAGMSVMGGGDGLGGLTAPGSAYYNLATSRMGQTFGLSSQTSYLSTAGASEPIAGGIGAPSLSGGGGMGSLAYGAGAAATVAVLGSIAAKAWQSTRGEKRGGGRFDFDLASGTTNFTDGPDGERAEGSDDLVKGLINTTVTGLNEAFKAFGKDITVAAMTGAYETSDKGRGGVFSGGRLSTGARFGEDGSGSNYDWSDPTNSKYELWGMESGAFGASGNFDLNGDPAKLAVDLQQSYIAAIQASVGLIPRLVKDTYQRELNGGSGWTQGASGMVDGEPVSDATTTRWVRQFSDDMKDSARELGLLPKKILDLIIDVDPEALSAEATAALTGKISALVTNVNSFRAIVEALPVEQLRDYSFDAAAGLMELAGSVEAFATNLSSYYDNFYSAEEKRQALATNIARELTDAGFEVTADQVLGSSRAQFREVFEYYAALGEAGVPVVNALLKINAGFASIIPAADDTSAALDGAGDALAKFLNDLEGYNKEFLTATEQRTMVAAKIRAELLAAGADFSIEQILGSTREKFRQVVEAFAGRTDEAGHNLYLTLLSVSGAFASIIPETATVSDALGGYSAALQNQARDLEDAVQRFGSFAQSLRAFRMELTMGALAQLSPEARYQATGAEFARLSQLDPASEERMAGLETAGRAFLDASQAYNASNQQYFLDLAKVAGAAQSSEGAAMTQVYISQMQLDVANAQLTALQAIQANTAGTTTTGSGSAGVGAAQTGVTGFQISDGVMGNTAGFLTFSNGLQLDWNAWVADNLGDPWGIAARAQGYGMTMADIARVMSKPAADVEQWFNLQGVPSFAVGTNRVQRDMLAMVHANEAIVPARYNPAAGGVGSNAALEAKLERLISVCERQALLLAEYAQRDLDQGAQLVESGKSTAAAALLQKTSPKVPA